MKLFGATQLLLLLLTVMATRTSSQNAFDVKNVNMQQQQQLPIWLEQRQTQLRNEMQALMEAFGQQIKFVMSKLICSTFITTVKTLPYVKITNNGVAIPNQCQHKFCF
jgi:hypothetical protein